MISSKTSKFGLFIRSIQSNFDKQFSDADLVLSYLFSTVNREKIFKLQFLLSDVLQSVVKPCCLGQI